MLCTCVSFFFFNDTATTEIYTLSLHDALPICEALPGRAGPAPGPPPPDRRPPGRDRKSTRLNSSHQIISYAVFCLKKKNWLGHGRGLPCTSLPCGLSRDFRRQRVQRDLVAAVR